MNCAWAAEAARDSGNGGYWQLALVLAGIAFLGLFARWRRMKNPPVIPAKELRERDLEPNRYRNAADKAIVDLLESSRVLNAQVDTKIRVLNRLVKEAEDTTAKLEALLAEARSLGERAATEERPPPPFRSSAVIETPEDSGQTPDSGSGEEEKNAPRKFMTDLHERIHHLKNEGKNVAAIAKATNLSTTEVEYIVKTL